MHIAQSVLAARIMGNYGKLPFYVCVCVCACVRACVRACSMYKYSSLKTFLWSCIFVFSIVHLSFTMHLVYIVIILYCKDRKTF